MSTTGNLPSMLVFRRYLSGTSIVVLTCSLHKSIFFLTKNMVRVNLMATVFCWHGFDKSKLVYVGEIQK